MTSNASGNPKSSLHAPDGECSQGAAAALGIDRTLGRWLLQKGPGLARRVRARQLMGGETSIDALWRGLVSIWCLSPSVRRKYPAEELRGLMLALADMDDDLAAALVQGLLEEAER